MTHRAIWHDPGCWWPSHVDFDDVLDAHLFALRKSREIGDEVTVHDITKETP